MSSYIPHSKPAVGLAEAAAAARVARGGQLAQGPEVAAFEAEAARKFGFRGAAAVSSGTAALELSLRALGVGPGHEVLIPTYVCAAPWHAVRRCGAEPVLVDCEEGGANMCLKDAARKRTRRSRAVVAAGLFGVPIDLKDAAALGLPVVDDRAQSAGAASPGPKPDVCVLSFYANKLIAAGEGGMALSADVGILERLRDLRECDERRPDKVRQNAKLTDLQAAVGRVQLRRLPELLAARERLARAYDEAFKDLYVELPPRVPGRVHYRYVLGVPGGRLDRLIARLERAGVAARRPVWRPLHWDVPCRGPFPHAECAWKTLLSVPLYPGLSRRDQARVVRALVTEVTAIFAK